MPASYTSRQPPSQPSNLLSFVTMETHCLYPAVPLSLNICSTKRSPVHRVQTHGTSHRDTNLYPPHNISSVHLTNNIHAAHWADYQWNAEWADNPTRLRIFIPDTGTHDPGMTLPRRAWVRLNRLRTGVERFPLQPAQMGYGLLCNL